MQISGTNSIASQTQTPSTTGTKPSTATSSPRELGPQDFMKLLLAEMKNQDPMRPMDDKEMIGQMAQLQSVQTMQSMSTNLKSGLAELTALQNVNLASGLIGKSVEATTTDGLVAGIVSSVTFGSDRGDVQLIIGDHKVNLKDLSRVVGQAPVPST